MIVGTAGHIDHGKTALVKALTGELARDGITINLVLPGTFLTARINPALKDEPEQLDPTLEAELAPLTQMIPMGRLGEPGEIASAALFLASDDASFVNGVELFVDGGQQQI